MVAAKLIQTALAVVMPIGVLWLARRSKIVRTVSPVVVCYILGMLFGSQGFIKSDGPFALLISGIAVALAIPLLLFSVNFIAWARLAGTTILSFFFCVISAMAAGAIAHYVFRGSLAETPKMAGMLAGVYIGCTGNMNAIGIMLGVKPETFVMLNTADMLMSLVYLAFLMTVAGKVFGKLLPPFRYADGKGPSGPDETWEGGHTDEWPRWTQLVPSVLLAVGIVAVGSAARLLVSQNSQDTVAILVITTLAILFSFVPKIRDLKGTQQFGQYLMLVFFFLIGVTSDLGKLFGSSVSIFLFDVVIITLSILIHLVLCMIFRIDRDTMIITSTATIFSPPFVPSVAMALKNKEMMVSGIASGLVGYAVANYAGVALAWALS